MTRRETLGVGILPIDMCNIVSRRVAHGTSRVASPSALRLRRGRSGFRTCGPMRLRPTKLHPTIREKPEIAPAVRGRGAQTRSRQRSAHAAAPHGSGSVMRKLYVARRYARRDSPTPSERYAYGGSRRARRHECEYFQLSKSRIMDVAPQLVHLTQSRESHVCAWIHHTYSSLRGRGTRVPCALRVRGAVARASPVPRSVQSTDPGLRPSRCVVPQDTSRKGTQRVHPDYCASSCPQGFDVQLTSPLVPHFLFLASSWSLVIQTVLRNLTTSPYRDMVIATSQQTRARRGPTPL